MRMVTGFAWSLVLLLGPATLIHAQGQPPQGRPATPTPPPPAPPPAAAPVTPPPSPTAVAAIVNGQPIPEIAVYRGLQRLPPEGQAQARPELIGFLIDNTLIDQYLAKANIGVDDKDVEPKFKQVQAEIKAQGMTVDEVMKRFILTEAELRTQIAAQLRWEKFVSQQATEQALRGLFDNNSDIFDGTMVRARHILITPAAGDPQSVEQARVRAATLKQQIETSAQQALTIQPATNDNLARERARTKALDEAFSAVAAKESMCPSKKQGGDLGFFPRAGSMVEPFAKAAFTLQPYKLSDVVTTQFGHHLILVTERKPGKTVKYEEIKDDVKEVFGDRMRDALLAQLRPQAKVVVNPPPSK